MEPRREYRRRDDTEVAILDALVDRREEGLSVFELRTRVDVDIDDLETALSELKSDDLIHAEADGERTVIHVDERVVPEGDGDADPSLLTQLRDRLGL